MPYCYNCCVSMYQEKLCNAAYCGKVQDVIQYLDSGVDINAQDWVSLCSN